MKESRIKVAGLWLRVREAGEGEPLLLIHGLWANENVCGPVEAALNDRRLITIDLPGMGRSSVPGRSLRVAGIARIVSGALDVLGYGRVDVLGYSLGGAVIQNLARQEPDRVRRLALVSTFCGFGTVPGSPAEIVSTSLPIRHYWPWFYERSYLWTVGGRKPPPEKMREQIARCSETPPPVLGYLWQWIAACS